MGRFTKVPSAPSDAARGSEHDLAVGRTNFGWCASVKHPLYGHTNPIDLSGPGTVGTSPARVPGTSGREASLIRR